MDITVTRVLITVTIHLLPTADPDSTTAGVQRVVDEYLNPLAWTYGALVRRNELISIIDQVGGVDSVDTLTITGQDASGNLVLPTASAVPDLGAITISIV